MYQSVFRQKPLVFKRIHSSLGGSNKPLETPLGAHQETVPQPTSGEASGTIVSSGIGGISGKTILL